MDDTEAYRLGWLAATYGDTREWCEKYGSKCVEGYDDYWAEYGPG